MKKMNIKRLAKKRGQIWVETVLYTLIGIGLIGVILAFAMPAIQKQRDKLTIERTIEAMNNIENSIENVKINGPSSTKQNILTISRGQLVIDGENDELRFEIDDSSYPYGDIPEGSTEGNWVHIPGSNQVIVTNMNGKKFKFISALIYNGETVSSANKLNITYKGQDIAKTLTKAQAPYVLMVENMGKSGQLTQINIYTSS